METTPHIRQKPAPYTEPSAMSPAQRPANPSQEPIPGGNIPTEVPPTDPDEFPDTGPTGPRTPTRSTIPESAIRPVPDQSPTICPAGLQVRCRSDRGQ
jgi:hypothetical protein